MECSSCLVVSDVDCSELSGLLAVVGKPSSFSCAALCWTGESRTLLRVEMSSVTRALVSSVLSLGSPLVFVVVVFKFVGGVDTLVRGLWQWEHSNVGPPPPPPPPLSTCTLSSVEVSLEQKWEDSTCMCTCITCTYTCIHTHTLLV